MNSDHSDKCERNIIPLSVNFDCFVKYNSDCFSINSFVTVTTKAERSKCYHHRWLSSTPERWLTPGLAFNKNVTNLPKRIICRLKLDSWTKIWPGRWWYAYERRKICKNNLINYRCKSFGQERTFKKIKTKDDAYGFNTPLNYNALSI